MARRGVHENPTPRFEPLGYELEPEEAFARQEGIPRRRTVLYDDPTRRILATNTSPDVPFEVSINPYRGCEHACPYCYARPNHEYLGLSAGLDFETKVLVKRSAPGLLRRELSKPSWRPQTIAFSGITDAYQPAERRLRITRGCLEVLAEFRNPVSIITKSALVKRDADLLAELARHDAAAVSISITSLEPDLQRTLEPRASAPWQRLAALEALARAGIPTGVAVAPIIPGLNDHEVPRILEAAAAAGASFAGHILVRLPHGVKELFEAWLERHLPERRDKVMSRIRQIRGGRLNDPRFGSRMRGEGVFAAQIHDLFELARKRAGIPDARHELSTAAFRRPGDRQLALFREA